MAIRPKDSTAFQLAIDSDSNSHVT
ncbi:hypothetical protein SKA53_04608 [Yoonia vestfoldensis SKA53]|uniref:Uncharacterized protein n=1 Tax=Yoonia vestfoldensis SKA53 TaxID=314232 RepID=A3V615_9RHOB|nr:hypothetical protein SKA53_04608 [Yoonia vestfoldensis SKA53]